MKPVQKLRLKYDWGPSCHFFDEAMAAHKFTGTEHALLWALRRVTFGEPDWERPGYRLESARVSLEEFQRRTGRSLAGIRKALENLEKSGVIIKVSGPHGVVATEYGINSRIAEWKVPRLGQVDATRYPGSGCHSSSTLACCSSSTLEALDCHSSSTLETSESSTLEPQKWHPSAQEVAPYESKSSTLAESQPNQDKGSDPPSEILREKEYKSKIAPDEKPEELSLEERAKRLTPSEAKAKAHLALCKTWQRISLSPNEELDLGHLFKSDLPSWVVLALIVKASEQTMAIRAELQADPDKRRYLSKRPLNDVIELARDLVAQTIAKRGQPPASMPPRRNLSAEWREEQAKNAKGETA